MLAIMLVFLLFVLLVLSLLPETRTYCSYVYTRPQNGVKACGGKAAGDMPADFFDQQTRVGVSCYVMEKKAMHISNGSDNRSVGSLWTLHPC
eukprot:778360-Amphidinium_carterae.1